MLSFITEDALCVLFAEQEAGIGCVAANKAVKAIAGIGEGLARPAKYLAAAVTSD